MLSQSDPPRVSESIKTVQPADEDCLAKCSFSIVAEHDGLLFDWGCCHAANLSRCHPLLQLRSNFMGTEFWFYDKGADCYSQNASSIRWAWNVRVERRKKAVILVAYRIARLQALQARFATLKSRL